MKIIYAFIFAAFLSTSMSAQISDDDNGRNSKQEKIQNRIESKKVAFITQKLDLTPTEAQQFWPLYNEYRSKMKDFRQQNISQMRSDDISEANANDFLDNLFTREQTELDLKKEYFSKLKTAISAKKVAKLYILEKKFRDEILENIRSRMGKKKRKKRTGDY